MEIIDLLSFQEVITDIKNLMQSKGINYTIIKKKDFEFSFKISFTINSQDFGLIFCADENFPYSKMKVFLDDFDKFLEWPHFEENGKICLEEDDAVINPYDYINNFKLTIINSIKLIKGCLDGSILNDLKLEFVSYWNRYVRKETANLSHCFIDLPKSNIALLNVASVKDSDIFYISCSKDNLNQYLKNIGAKISSEYNALYITLDYIPLPKEYDNLIDRCFDEIKKQGKEKILLLKECLGNKKFKIIISFINNEGDMFAGISIDCSNIRKNKLKKTTFDKYRRRFINIKKESFIVKQAYHGWVYGRNNNPYSEILKKKRIAILGCGSVGSFVADNLAMTGIGTIDLVDYDGLQFSNISRNKLGSLFTSKYKTESLKFVLNMEYPNIVVNSHVMTSQQFLENMDASMYDLVICCTANFASEVHLNSLKMSSEDFPPVLYAFAENKALAGHGICIIDNFSCFECLFRDVSFLKSIVKENKILKEPGCGGYFNPYGGVEINNINLMVSKVALDILLGRIIENKHFIWLSNDIKDSQLTTFGNDLLCNHPEGSVRSYNISPKEKCVCGR